MGDDPMTSAGGPPAEPSDELSGSIVITGIGELVTNDPAVGGLLGIVRDATVVVEEGVVVYAGPSGDLGGAYAEHRTIDAEGRAVIPGFVDAHTHAVFAGDRASEFHARLRGASYEDVLAAGGGIYSTVAATREAGFVELIGKSLPRFRRMASTGTTTVEVKTGYGLDLESEFQLASAINAISMSLPMDLVPTFLGAHVVAPEYAGRPDDYIDLVVGDMLPAIAPFVRFVDVFCDDVAFSVDQTRRVAEAATAHELPVRLHADQTSHSGGAALAAEIGAVSADHLDHATDEDFTAMATAGTTAVLLPGVSYSLGTPPPNGRRVWDSGVTVALATDCNPGTAYVETMPFVISLAVTQGGLRVEEAVWASTAGGAAALAMDDRGRLTPGAIGDMAVLDAPTHEHLAYRPDAAMASGVVKAGVLL